MYYLRDNIIIERYYRGAVVLIDQKIYMLNEALIAMIEKIISGQVINHNQERLKQLKQLGLIIERSTFSTNVSAAKSSENHASCRTQRPAYCLSEPKE